MTTRYNRQYKTRFGVPPLPTGYDSTSAPSSLTIPPVGLEDVDVSLFNLFDKEVGFQVSDEKAVTKKVPVVFAAGEKWALLKRQKALRDRNNTLILPLVTVVRKTVQQLADEDITGRGINQQTGDIMIKRRLDSSDRAYQGLVNRMLLQHQQNIAVNTGAGDSGQVTTSRVIGDLIDDPTVQSGGVLVPDMLNNVWEFIIIPTPQFFTAIYEVTFWTQYTTQMNQLLEQLVSSFLPQGNSWRLDTPKGYWFVASVDSNTYTSDDNSDDFSREERIIKYGFTVKVPAYVLVSSALGIPIPVRRYVSSPSISFEVATEGTEQVGTIVDPFLGADDPTLPLANGKTMSRDQRETNETSLYPGPGAQAQNGNPDDLALAALRRGTSPATYQKITGINKDGNVITKMVRVINVNRFTGETVLAPDAALAGLTIVANED